LREISRIASPTWKDPRHYQQQQKQQQQAQELQSRFEIVHTPDRLTPPARPTPTDEECREEIRKWHRVADKERGWGDPDPDPVVSGSNVSPTGEKGRERERERESRGRARVLGKEGAQRGRARYEFRDWDDEPGGDGEDEEERKWEEEELAVVEMRLLRVRSGSPKSKYYEAGQRKTTRPKRDTFGRDEGDGSATADIRAAKGKKDQERRNAPDYESFPLFNPPRPLRGDEDLFGGGLESSSPFGEERGDIPPMLQVATAQTSGSRFPRTWNQPKSPLISSLAQVSDDDSASDYGEQSSPNEPQPPVDKTQLIKMELYRRGVCPFCRRMLSRIEAVRCAGCQADLASCRNYQPESEARASHESETKALKPRLRPGYLSPPPAHRSPPPKSPPLLRERLYHPTTMEADIESAIQNMDMQAAADKTAVRFAHFSAKIAPIARSQRERGAREPIPSHRRAASSASGQRRDEPPEDVSVYHKWQTPEQRAEFQRLDREGLGTDADLFMDIYDDYGD